MLRRSLIEPVSVTTSPDSGTDIPNSGSQSLSQDSGKS